MSFPPPPPPAPPTGPPPFVPPPPAPRAVPAARKPSSLLPLLVVGALGVFAIAAAVAIAGMILYMNGGVFSRPIDDTPAPAVETQPTPSEAPPAVDPGPEPPPADAPAAESAAPPEADAERDERRAPAPVRDREPRPARRPDTRPEAGDVVLDQPARRTAPAQQAVRVGGQIEPPAKVRNVHPVYPAIAQQARVQGVVIIEATIDPTGKVTDTRVLRSIPLLDQAALEAVRQWEYEPTRLNGVAVPVIMTVTVNFTLSRD